jgi:hypothetical protein
LTMNTMIVGFNYSIQSVNFDCIKNDHVNFATL